MPWGVTRGSASVKLRGIESEGKPLARDFTVVSTGSKTQDKISRFIIVCHFEKF